MKTLNLGILAHVDAGKTSLTERLLFAGGVIGELGSVDSGNTLTDSLALERQRGITIKSAVASFAVGDTTVNLIDTPGHPDFIAEVERVLQVLDGAVLVVSAVEGVQAQTRVLMRALRRLRLPTLIFVNKIDRSGARGAALLQRLSLPTVALGSVTRAGSRDATFEPFDADDSAFCDRLADVLTAQDDSLLKAYIDGGVTAGQWREALSLQTKQALVHPVYFGSAITGAGVDDLTRGIEEFLPHTAGDPAKPLSGSVFKVERGVTGEKIAYVRLFEGMVQVRDRIPFGRGKEGKVTAIEVFGQGSAATCSSVAAGQIGKLYGLTDIRIGDAVGVARDLPLAQHFAPPTLETVVTAVDPAGKGLLHVALTQLAEQDPLINLRQDEARQELSLSLYGEVQKEVIQATLLDDFGVEVAFRETTTICIEQPVGTGEAVEFIRKEPNPFLATVGLRVEPAEPGSGIRFQLGVEPGAMPPAFFKALEETVHETLEQGLYGWQVADCTVTMTHSGYWARQSHSHGTFDKSMSSTAGDFRQLTPLVLMSALRQAGTSVHEPVHRFVLELPADLFTPVLPLLARLRAVVRAPVSLGSVSHSSVSRGTVSGGSVSGGSVSRGSVSHGSVSGGSVSVLEGDIPAAHVHELQQRLPGLTRGEGVLESTFDHYQPLRGTVLRRPRTDHNPLNRKEYLLHVLRRV